MGVKADQIRYICLDLWDRERVAFLWVRLLLKMPFADREAKPALWFHLAKFFHAKRWWRPYNYCQRVLEKHYKCVISVHATIGRGVRLPHPFGIVIGMASIVGDYCTIYDNVTLGGARQGDDKAGNQPVLGTGATILSGAKILGKVEIAPHAVIGPNSVVARSVDPDAYAEAPEGVVIPA